MNNISQISIFDYTEIENLGDLEKLKLFLDNVEDDDSCKNLEEERATGIEHPKDKAGNYMPLLLQINLKDIELDGYPKEGIVEIFTDKDVDYPCQYIVKYFKDVLDYQTEFSK